MKYLFAYLFLFIGSSVFSQTELTRLSGEIEFDGIPNEPAWKEGRLPVVMHEPIFMGEDIRGDLNMSILYDDEFIWVGAIITYEEEKDIKAISKKRDSFDGGNDYFGVILDTYNDNENNLAFMTTPAGLRWDGAFFNDAQGDMPVNVSWNTFWNVKSKIEGKVWQLEMKIPFTSLKFQSDGEKTIMGMTMWWWSTEMGQTLMFPAIERNWGGWSSFKSSQFEKVVFKGIQPKKPIYIAPYAIGGLQNEYSYDESSGSFELNKNRMINFGGDVKINLSPGWTMDLTVNTDFAQVEADNQQVNLTRFNLFFPEKRIFFQERSSVFNVGTGNFNQLFYSRRIGLDQNASVVPILGGLRTIGRAGKWDIAFLDMQTAKTENQLSTNYGLARLRRQIGETNSYAGGIVTNQLDTEGNYDLTAAIDGIFDLGNNKYLNIVATQTTDTSSEYSAFDRAKLYAFFENRSLTGIQYSGTYAYIGSGFDPAMGFELRKNNHQFAGNTGYGWVAKDESRFLNQRVLFETENFMNIEDGKFDSELYALTFYSETKNAASQYIALGNYQEFIRQPFNLYGAEIDAGQYNYYGAEFFLSSKSSGWLYMETSGYAGQFFNGRNYSINVQPYFRPGPLLNAWISYQIVKLDFDEVANDNMVHFLSSNIEFSPTTSLTFSFLMQYNNYDKSINSNFRFRYNPKEGNDLFLVINDVENTERTRFMPEIPQLPSFDSRNIMLKYIYTFVTARK